MSTGVYLRIFLRGCPVVVEFLLRVALGIPLEIFSTINSGIALEISPEAFHGISSRVSRGVIYGTSSRVPPGFFFPEIDETSSGISFVSFFLEYLPTGMFSRDFCRRFISEVYFQCCPWDVFQSFSGFMLDFLSIGFYRASSRVPFKISSGGAIADVFS